MLEIINIIFKDVIQVLIGPITLMLIYSFVESLKAVSANYVTVITATALKKDSYDAYLFPENCEVGTNSTSVVNDFTHIY